MGRSKLARKSKKSVFAFDYYVFASKSGGINRGKNMTVESTSLCDQAFEMRQCWFGASFSILVIDEGTLFS